MELDLYDGVGDCVFCARGNDAIWLVGDGLCLCDETEDFGVHGVMPAVQVRASDCLLVVYVEGGVVGIRVRHGWCRRRGLVTL